MVGVVCVCVCYHFMFIQLLPARLGHGSCWFFSPPLLFCPFLPSPSCGPPPRREAADMAGLPRAPLGGVCVCVILYLYPAICSPKGHDSGSAAALAAAVSCF